MTDSSCVIVGASHAGGQLAVSLRQQGWQGRILVIGEEPYLPYNRPPLSKTFLSGQKQVDDLLIRPQAQYEKVGIEFLLGHMLKKAGANVMELPNEKRVDLCINSYYKISIKYSSSGDITLHNSNGSVNKDLVMTDFLLLTPKNLYLITNKELCEYGIDVTKYLKNTGDSLRLKRSLLPVLKRKKYQYMMDFNIEIDKSQCKNRLTSKVFFEYLLCQFSKE